MRYTSITQFEPLLPHKQLDELLTLAQTITEVAIRLRSALHPITQATVAKLLREMNSYYSNKIEGHHTHPVHCSLRQTISDDSQQPSSFSMDPSIY